MDMIPQGEIERRILVLDQRLDDLTHEYRELSDEAAEAEADYKAKYARTIVSLAADADRKLTVQEREARADFHTENEFRAYRLADARARTTREALLTHRSRLDALRTLSANVRALTTTR